jgi:hypothetical protein
MLDMLMWPRRTAGSDFDTFLRVFLGANTAGAGAPIGTPEMGLPPRPRRKALGWELRV